MAEALVKKIEKNFLSCCICFEQLNDPIGLPCLHTFCFGCLQNWHDKSSEIRHRVICPMCKTPALVPADGIRGFPGHFLVKNLKETVDREKTKVESSPIKVGNTVRIIRGAASRETKEDEDIGKVQSIKGDEITVSLPSKLWKGSKSEVELWDECEDAGICELCEEPSKSYCLNCKQYLCDQCCRSHNAFKAMKNHEVVAASDVLSGRISSTGRHCDVHNEPVKYYCMTEGKQVCQDCVSLKSCPLEHDRVALAKAARQLVITLQQLLLECDKKREIFRESLTKTEKVKSDLQTSHDNAQEALEKVMAETNKKLEEMWAEKKSTLAKIHAEKEEVLKNEESDLNSMLKKAQETNDMVLDAITNGSDYDVTYKYPTMKATLESIASAPKPNVTDESLGDLQFDPGKPENYINADPQAAKPAAKVSKEKSLRDTWWLLWDIELPGSFRDVSDIAQRCSYGDMVFSSYKDGVKVIDNRGDIKCTLQNAPKTVYSVAMTSDERIIIDGRAKLLKFNENGRMLGTIVTRSSSSSSESPPVAVTLDDKGRIIAGLQDGTINIYYADGTLYTQFKFSQAPIYISATTSYNRLVVTFHESVLLISYEGEIEDWFLRPPGVLEWDPGATCCSPKGEVYVINRSHPRQIYAYECRMDVKYVGETGIYNAKAMSFSEDGQRLVVAEDNGEVHLYMRH